MDMNTSKNPLLEINTSFTSYLEARTRNSTEHIVDGRMDYAFDGDFAMRNKISTVSGWSKVYKSITSGDMPAEYRRLYRITDEANSMVHSKIYNIVNKCSERMQVSPPAVRVKSVQDIPEIYSVTGDGFTPCIVITADIEDICGEQELCYLIGCELGRIQNNHPPFAYAFSNSRTEIKSSSDSRTVNVYKQIEYTLESWQRLADFTADRAGIICLDKPEDFPSIYVSLRGKAIIDSFGNTNTTLTLSDILDRYDEVRRIPVRALKLGSDVTQDERRIMAGMEFIGCEILYSWRKDLKNSGHLTNKQSLEIRCELLAADADAASDT